jgi:hypothetical protein
MSNRGGGDDRVYGDRLAMARLPTDSLVPGGCRAQFAVNPNSASALPSPHQS